MAKTHAAAAVLAAVLLATVCGASAQMPAAAPGPAVDECINNLTNLTDCLTYVEEGSKLTAPQKPCCGELASLLDNNPICLCELLSKADSFGFKIDINRALKLPTVCNVATSPSPVFFHTTHQQARAAFQWLPRRLLSSKPSRSTKPAANNIPPMENPALSPRPSGRRAPSASPAGIRWRSS